MFLVVFDIKNNLTRKSVQKLDEYYHPYKKYNVIRDVWSFFFVEIQDKFGVLTFLFFFCLKNYTLINTTNCLKVAINDISCLIK